MENERLRATMASRGLSAQALADKAGVDAKTVERWINAGRIPYARTAFRAAEALEEDPMFLWPTLHRRRPGHAVTSEVITVYGQRSQVAPSDWRALFQRAETNIDILVYAANHLHESVPGFNSLLAAKAENGCAVRIALGDPDSPNVIARGEEEEFGHGIESRCRLALMHYRALMGTQGIELRIHGTTLYNSIYRADDEMLINAHVWGANAFSAPVWHIRRTPGAAMFPTYVKSFEDVWAQSEPVT